MSEQADQSSGADQPTGEVHAAGEGLSDEEMLEQVGEQTSSDLKYADVFKREADGTSTDVEVAKASADELAGE